MIETKTTLRDTAENLKNSLSFDTNLKNQADIVITKISSGQYSRALTIVKTIRNQLQSSSENPIALNYASDLRNRLQSEVSDA